MRAETWGSYPEPLTSLRAPQERTVFCHEKKKKRKRPAFRTHSECAREGDDAEGDRFLIFFMFFSGERGRMQRENDFLGGFLVCMYSGEVCGGVGVGGRGGGSTDHFWGVSCVS